MFFWPYRPSIGLDSIKKKLPSLLQMCCWYHDNSACIGLKNLKDQDLNLSKICFVFKLIVTTFQALFRMTSSDSSIHAHPKMIKLFQVSLMTWNDPALSFDVNLSIWFHFLGSLGWNHQATPQVLRFSEANSKHECNRNTRPTKTWTAVDKEMRG